jgi:hypothetical protein
MIRVWDLVHIALLLMVYNVAAGEVPGCTPHRRLLTKSRTLAQSPAVGKARSSSQ